MSLKRTHIVMPADLVDQIDELVGKRRRSAFVTEAAKLQIERQLLLRALEKSSGAWSDRRHPELRDGADRFIERQRRSDEARDRKRRGDLSR